MIDYGPECEGDIKKIFKGKGTDQNISDVNLRDYSSVEPLQNTEDVFDSFLYVDPYPKCKCGNKGDSDLEKAYSGQFLLIFVYFYNLNPCQNIFRIPFVKRWLFR